jgi:hypothetical protein
MRTRSGLIAPLLNQGDNSQIQRATDRVASKPGTASRQYPQSTTSQQLASNIRKPTSLGTDLAPHPIRLVQGCGTNDAGKTVCFHHQTTHRESPMKKFMLLAVAGVGLALAGSSQADAGHWNRGRSHDHHGGSYGFHGGSRYHGPGLSGYSRYSPGLYGYRSFGYRDYGYRDYGHYDDCHDDYGRSSRQLNVFFGDGGFGIGYGRFRR